MGSDYPHLEGSTFEKYAQERLKQEGQLEEEIQEAAVNQEERLASTPEADWEKRYKELEQHNSRQAQELGTLRSEVTNYKTAFDEYLLNDSPTPAEEETVLSVTTDDLLERPHETINQAIESHPAIVQAKDIAEKARKQAILDAKGTFESKHPKYQETMSDPAFADWVRESGTRVSLAQRADQWDFDAADALFSLYESEQALNGITQKNQADQAFEQAQLESAGIGEPPPDARYSRTEMRELMISAKRGDQKAERYLNTHLPKYRAALAAGEVTD